MIDFIIIAAGLALSALWIRQLVRWERRRMRRTARMVVQLERFAAERPEYAGIALWIAASHDAELPAKHRERLLQEARDERSAP